jgi:hypothetical protein
MVFALAWCGLIAAAGTAAGTTLFVVGVLIGDRSFWLGPIIAFFGIIQLGPAGLLWVAVKRMYRRPPSGMWFAVSGLCCYAAEGFVPVLVFLEQPHKFWWLVQWFGLPGWALLGTAALVVWAVRTSPAI